MSSRYQYEKQQQRRANQAMPTATAVRVIRFDSATMTADVQPLGQRMVNGSYQTQPPILSVPVAHNRGGQYTMTQLLQAGDTGYVTFLNNDPDASFASGQEGAPNTSRSHSDTDAVFTGGISMGGGPANSLPDGSFGFGTLDASLFVIIHEGKIKIKGDVEIEGNVLIQGNLHVDGNITASGTITP